MKNISLEGISLVRQDVESYSSLRLIFKGCAKQLEPEFPGDIRFQFPSEGNDHPVVMRFDWVSSVLYCDEMLWTAKSYPYFKDAGGTSGLFLVENSSYLKRFELYYPNHSHYIYFDIDFNWHITAKGIEILK